MEKEQQKTEKDGSLEAGSSRRSWKGLHWSARGLAGLGRWARVGLPPKGVHV